MKRSLFGLALALGLSGLWLGVANDASGDEFMTANVRWQTPTTGAPAVRYLLRIRDLDGSLYETYSVEAVSGSEQSFVFTKVQFAHQYQARVAGIDARGRQGPWSNWSAIYDRESSVPAP
jgi:hypothetical protein